MNGWNLSSMTLCGFEITSQMIPRQRWDNGQVYHIGLKVLHVIVLLVRKEIFLSQTTVHHINAEYPRDPNFQDRISDYHDSLEDGLRGKDVGNTLDVYYYLVNDDEQVIAKGEPNKEVYQGTPDSLYIYEILDNCDEQREANYYDQ